MSNIFYRDIYFDTLNAFKEKKVVFLLGPRKCGKTFCLSQLEKEFKNCEYIDFKEFTDENSSCLVNKIVMSISMGESITYLLDEVTYMYHPEEEIARIASAYTNAKANGVTINTNIVFTGSQSVALKSWGLRAFCNQAKYINADFLNYAEWMRYKNINEVSADSFKEFVTGTREFYNFTSLKDYLEGCLEETVISNVKSRNIVIGNDCSLLTVDTLINVLYATLFSLHDRSSSATFFKKNNLESRIKYLINSNQLIVSFDKEELKDKISKSFINKYDVLNSTDYHTLKQALVFLYKCELITLTPVFDNFESSMNVFNALNNYDERLATKQMIFENINISIKYPMFFMEILRDILGTDYNVDMLNSIMGGVVECYIRGLLPDSYSFEYHDELGKEIDYVNLDNSCGIEISISNKNDNETNFDILPEGYEKVLLTKDKRNLSVPIKRIPYYEYIYNLCVNPNKIVPLNDLLSKKDKII